MDGGVGAAEKALPPRRQSHRNGQKKNNTGGDGGHIKAALALTCQMLSGLMGKNKRELGFMKTY